MSVYVMVTADFPFIDATQRVKIYECLKNKNVVKITEAGRDITTVWQAYFEGNVTNEAAITAIKNIFVECSKPYNITPKLVIHAGPNKPSVY